jgi:hypothetical protein
VVRVGDAVLRSVAVEPPVQIMGAEDRGWHSGPWKPCLRYGAADARRMHVFFDGQYLKKEPSPFPFVFNARMPGDHRPE